LDKKTPHNSTFAIGEVSCSADKSPNTDRAVEWFLIGFSPRKANLTVYLMDMKKHADALKKLGKHKIGGGCLYINKLADVDVKVLKGMIETSLKENK